MEASFRRVAFIVLQVSIELRPPRHSYKEENLFNWIKGACKVLLETRRSVFFVSISTIPISTDRLLAASRSTCGACRAVPSLALGGKIAKFDDREFGIVEKVEHSELVQH